jgi:hypothetical protein
MADEQDVTENLEQTNVHLRNGVVHSIKSKRPPLQEASVKRMDLYLFLIVHFFVLYVRYVI